jgi:peptidyl-prolyl cis-trans isomerase A (cyclophilin A)
MGQQKTIRIRPKIHIFKIPRIFTMSRIGSYAITAGMLLLALLGCGGGGWSGADPITGITATNFKYGQLATLTLTGNALDNVIKLSSDKCAYVTLGAIESSSVRHATCIVAAAGPIQFTVKSSADYVVYNTTLNSPDPVTSITANNLQFGAQATLTLAGDPQNSAIQLKSDKCTNIVLDPVSTAATRTAKCTLVGAGPVSFSITSLSGATNLFQTSITATEPTSVQIYNTKYGQTTTVVYPTLGQNANLSLVATGCTELTMDAGTYPSVRTATCKVSSIGNLSFDVKNLSTNAIEQTITTSVGNPQVTFKTSLGDFVMELNPTAAPNTVNNFLAYVNQSPSFYNGTIFHRVISGFMAQGGGFTTGMNQKPEAPTGITLESQNGLLNVRGAVAMARKEPATGSPETDATKNSATSQFFVNLVDNAFLNYSSANSPGYAVFGKVVSGMDVIDLMATKATGTKNGYSDVPVTDITITSATQTQ